MTVTASATGEQVEQAQEMAEVDAAAAAELVLEFGTKKRKPRKPLPAAAASTEAAAGATPAEPEYTYDMARLLAILWFKMGCEFNRRFFFLKPSA